MNDQELSVLFEKLLNNQCSEEEADRIIALLADEASNTELKGLIVDQLKQQPAGEFNFDEHAAIELALNRRLEAILNEEPTSVPFKQKFLSIKRILFMAATVLVFFSAAFYLFTKKEVKPMLTAKPVKPLIIPGSNKATLTLSNGTKINLADAADGNIASQGGVAIKKAGNGVLIYDDKTKKIEDAPAEPLFNTVTTPKGGQFKVVLPDGSSVWLNAASSLTYPAQFAPNERIVELDGEGYFEIACIKRIKGSNGKCGKVPFIVMSNHQRIEVFGTKFNVNAYNDESEVKTTLLEGSVSVGLWDQRGQQLVQAPKMLVPGQQATLAENNIKIKEVNTELATAWKNGSFQFDNESIEVVMRKIERWYDVDVDYRGNMEGKIFAGSISKYTDVNEVLKMLQLTGSVSFTIRGRKIVVH